MRKTLNDTQLIKTISSSKAPLTADQIAHQLGALRHKVTPFLRNLVSSGQIEEVQPSGEFPFLRFVYRQNAAGSQDQAPGKVVQIASGRRKEDEDQPKSPVAAKTAAKPATEKRQPRKPLAAVPSAPPAPAASIKENPPVVTAKAEAKVAPAKPATTAKAAVVAAESMRDQVLRMLAAEPTPREEILTNLGPIGTLLTEMTANDEIFSEYIINEHIFQLTEKGNAEFSKLGEAPASVPVETQIAPVAAEPAITTPVQPVQEPVVLPVVEPVAAKPEVEAPVVAAPAPAPAAAPAPVAVAASKPEAKAPALNHDNPIMKEMAALMEKLVNERLGDISQKLQAGERDRETLVKVGAGIQKATAGLQLALDALNEIAETISAS